MSDLDTHVKAAPSKQSLVVEPVLAGKTHVPSKICCVVVVSPINPMPSKSDPVLLHGAVNVRQNLLARFVLT